MRSTPRWRRLGALACAAALVLSLVPGTAAAAGPAQSRNIHKNDYTTWSRPVTSYLYGHNGGLTRVEYTGGQIVVEDYDSSFALQSSRTVPMELSIWGGFFAGEDYNFLIFGQSNPSESDSAEVIRVVKYDKDWNRLGQASLRGANTTVPFDAGSLRCDEYGGYLYLRTSHEMYTSDDGLNHQSNLTMAVRQSDMSITDSYYDVMNISYGYVSHSFNQFVLVDEDGRLVALDHGDASPRSVVFTKYYADAGTGRFTGSRYGQWCSYGDMLEFAGATGANATGGSVGGLAETRDCYIMAYSYNGTGQGSGDRYPYYHYMDKASGRSWQVQINLPGCTTPVLAPTGLDGGYMLWNGKSGSTVSDTLYYLAYSADGQPGQYQTAQAPLSDCQPIPWEDGVVWYVTDGGAPTFYTLDGSGVTAHPAGASAPEPTPDPEPDPGQAASFTDVPASAWYAEYAGTAASAGLMNGTGSNRFSPSQTLSVAEVVTLAARLCAGEAGEAVPASGSGQPWYRGAYDYCVDSGLFTAAEVPLSAMNSPATRFQMVDILDRAVPDSEKAAIHSDVTVPDLAQSAPYGGVVYRWYRAGITQGDQNGNFNGSSHITRAETAAILCRLAGLAERV